MGSETVIAKIPVVDLSGFELKPGSDSWKSACQDVRIALETYGCFELVYDELNFEFHNKILESIEELFNLPLEIKKKKINPIKPAHGYQQGKDILFPIHESMGIEHPTNEQPFQDFTHIMWPHGNQHFYETIHSYAKLMDEVHEVLVRMLCASYDVEKEYTESCIEWTYLMLLLKYRRSEEDSNMVLRGHMDKNFLSILHQNHVKGLEISRKHGDDDHSKNGDDDHQWIPYLPSSHCSFIVIAGDACMGWSNDRIKSCYHRVVVEDEQIRYSIGLASFLKGLIKAPKELVDEEHPLKYKPFENESLLHFYNSSNDPNRNDINMVKALCGI